ncbi:hypothetical protein Peur_047321 [Populus x canadensis]
MGNKGDRRRLVVVEEKEAVTVSIGDWSEDWTDDWSEDLTDDWVTGVKTGLIVAAFVVAVAEHLNAAATEMVRDDVLLYESPD